MIELIIVLFMFFVGCHTGIEAEKAFQKKKIQEAIKLAEDIGAAEIIEVLGQIGDRKNNQEQKG